MRLFRACDCYDYPCLHNPPDGYEPIKFDGRTRFVLIKKPLILKVKMLCWKLLGRLK